MARLPRVGSVRVTGPDRIAFLHGIVANDLRSAPTHGRIRTLVLDIKGHAILDMTVHLRENDVHLACEDDAAADVLSLLERQRIFDDVAFENVSETLTTLTIQGPRAQAFLEGALESFPESDDVFVQGRLGSSVVLVSRSRRSGPGGFDLFALSHQLEEVETALGLEPGWQDSARHMAALHALEASRVEHRLPRAGLDAGPGVLPQESGLTDFISTRKGCYVGQEIMARIEARAQLKRHLVLLQLTNATNDTIISELTVGNPVLERGKTVGRIGTIVEHPVLGWIALAVVQRSVSQDLMVGRQAAAILHT